MHERKKMLCIVKSTVKGHVRVVSLFLAVIDVFYEPIPEHVATDPTEKRH